MSFHLNGLSREELYSVVDQMKRRINCLENDLIKIQTLFKSYDKYFDLFNKINENISSNKEMLVFIEKLRQLSNSCLISATKIPENDFNHLRLKSVETNVGSTDVWTQTYFKDRPQSTQIEVKYENNENPIIIENIRSLLTNDNQRLNEDNESEFIANEDNLIDNSCEEGLESKSTSNTTCAYKAKKRKIRTHSSRAVFCCSYKGCSAKFSSRRSLNHHKTSHSRRYICDLKGCAFRAGSSYHLVRHKKTAHSNERPFICCAQKCDKRFKIRADLRRHSKTCHSELTFYECEYPECGQTFADQKSFNNHKDIHLGPLVCHFDGCDFQTKDQNQLKQHHNSHNFKHLPNKHMCDHIGCGQQFTNSSQLVEHKHIHQSIEYENPSNLTDSSSDITNQQNINELRSGDNEVDDNCIQIENPIIFEDIKSLITNVSQRISEDNVTEDNFNDNSIEKEIYSKSAPEFQMKVSYENNSNVSDVSSDVINNIQNIKTELMSDGYEVDHNYLQNGSQLITENIKSFVMSENQRLNEDNESEFIANEINFSDNSCEEWLESKSTSNTTSAYNKRRKRTYNSSNGMFCCPFDGCSAKFNSEKSLKCHELRHSNRYRCDWDGCHFTSVSNYHLERHKNQSHSDERPFICCAQNCDKTFKIRPDLKRHLKTCHSDLTLYVCEYPKCYQMFSDQNLLKNHEDIHNVRTNKGRYGCIWKDCTFVATSNYELSQHHHSSHSTQPLLKCQINGCGKPFKLKQYLIRHHLREHPLEFEDFPWIECERSGCDFKTKCKDRMCEHMDVHKDIHKCCVCLKTFKTSQLVKKHMSVHSGNTFACEWPECHKVFRWKHNLTSHMNVHTGDKTYPCDWPGCYKTFALKVTQIAHIKRHKN